MTTTDLKQITAARGRGYDRAQTIYKVAKQAGKTVTQDADELAGQLYPDNTELQSACAEGLRLGWAEAAKAAK